VALTAFAQPSDRTKALRAGFQSHVAKPVEARELVTTIGTLLSQ
jgi:CheY-like chemotaxis protein